LNSKLPLLIYGGSSAIGTFAVKLALRSNIHPLIVVAGKSRDFVESLLQRSKGDTVIDYREGPDAAVRSIQEALEVSRSGPAYHAFDSISEHDSFQTLSRVLDPKGHITLVHPDGDYTSIPLSITTSLTYVGIAHTVAPDISRLKGIRHVGNGNGKDLAFVISRLIGKGLQEKWFSGHPYEIVPGGQNGLSTALRKLKQGKAHAVKYVLKPEDSL
jgi:NADPH:quinone reductase-like Zn-dependent oxidoreductase